MTEQHLHKPPTSSSRNVRRVAANQTSVPQIAHPAGSGAERSLHATSKRRQFRLCSSREKNALNAVNVLKKQSKLDFKYFRFYPLISTVSSTVIAQCLWIQGRIHNSKIVFGKWLDLLNQVSRNPTLLDSFLSDCPDHAGQREPVKAAWCSRSCFSDDRSMN